MKLLVATFNPAKQQEFSRIFTTINQSVELIFPDKLGLKDEVEETGQTFAANSALKAKHFYRLTQLNILADDGGLEIPALNNEPGVHSRRWLGYAASDQELIDYTFERLKNWPDKKDRQARLKTCVSFYDGRRLFQEEADIKGYIALQPSKKRTRGYPFRDLFIVAKFNKYYNQLTAAEHAQINHRQQAVKRLMVKLR